MRKRIGWIVVTVLSALLLGVVAFRPQVSLAETVTPTPKTLDVTGQGKLTAKYDTASINLGFSTLRDTPTGAYQDMSDAMNKVVDVLKANGIKEEEMQTGTFNLGAQYDWKEGTQSLAGYRATNTLTVETQALDKVAALIEKAVDVGANTVNGVSFSIKNTDELLNQALDAAVDDARAKADRVAKKLGTEVTGVLRVSVQDQGRPPIYYGGVTMDVKMAASAVREPAPVFSGSGDYSAVVSVTFEIK